MYVPMKDAKLELQAPVTRTASLNGAWLDLGEDYTPGGLGTLLAGVAEVSAVNIDTNESYSLKLQQTKPDGSGEPDSGEVEDIGVPVSATEEGIVVAKGICTQRFIRLVLTVSGADPSITYSAHVGL